MRITDMPEFIDKKTVLSLEKSVSVQEAIDAMKTKGVGSIIITDKGKLAGIFTERDVLNRVIGVIKDLSKTKIDEVMTKDVSTAKVSDRVMDSMRRMSQGRFRHLPVVDENGDVIGLLSQGDFVALTMSDAWRRFTETAKAGFFAGSQPILVLIGFAIYTIVLISFLMH